MEKQICKPHTHCRACGSNNLVKYLSLGDIPLANNLENTQEEAINAERFPLEIMLCTDCGLSQLSVVIDPEKLFSYYTYRSGINGGYIKHCRQMAKDLKEKYNLNKDSFVIDIAGNDGTLLLEFWEELKCLTLNVDPATNLADISFKRGIRTLNEFWSKKVAEYIAETEKADVIIATNVFAHVDNIKEFLEAAKIALKPNGILVIECPYVVDHIEKLEYTQTYFEHLSYMSITPIYILCEQLGLKILDVEKQDIHGGTIRITITPEDSILRDSEYRPGKYLDFEYDGKYLSLKTYKEWAEKVKKSIYNLAMDIGVLKLQGKKIAGFSASAKGNTLLNSALLNHELIDYIIDETPEKQTKYSPGTGIPIIGIDVLKNGAPDYLILLSWNFKDEIMEKCRKLGYKGKFIIPIPEFQIID